MTYPPAERQPITDHLHGHAVPVAGGSGEPADPCLAGRPGRPVALPRRGSARP